MFQALYRKYRPQKFDDIVGQNHIVSVLKNAIEKDQISHAYLFYGPRGTGKTSIAKIFANEVNHNEVYQKENVDIMEIDAASNNGVDEVRDIKEAIKFLPTEGKYKIYIIDEVHMLTTAAFNALLKTLEEPPAHVIFILATTEIHKIPATILSRCQRFEFKNLSNKQLVDRLNYIANNENLKIEERAIEKIASLAKGGLRDAISILDQVSNYADEITLENILEVTSSISEDDILEFYKKLLQKDTTEALLMYNNFVSAAKDTKLLLNDLINVTRDAIVFKNLHSSEYTDYDIEKIADVVDGVPFDYFYKIIENFSQTEQYIRFSTEYVSYMQICIVKICSEEITQSAATPQSSQSTPQPSVGASVAVAKVDELENRVKILEDKLFQLRKTVQNTSTAPKVAPQAPQAPQVQQTTSQAAQAQQEVPKEEIKEVIIPNKGKIIELINTSNDAYRQYAASVFDRIIKESLNANNSEVQMMRDLFKSCKLVASSKNSGLLIFDEMDNMVKMAPSSKYKKYLEELFKRFIGVPYTIYTLQNHQYNILLNEIEDGKKEVVEEVSEVVEEKSKVEQLFGDIIVEKGE